MGVAQLFSLPQPKNRNAAKLGNSPKWAKWKTCELLWMGQMSITIVWKPEN